MLALKDMNASLANTVEQVRTGAHTIAAAAESMQDEAGNLAGLINVFKFGDANGTADERQATVVTPLRPAAPLSLVKSDVRNTRRIARG